VCGTINSANYFAMATKAASMALLLMLCSWPGRDGRQRSPNAAQGVAVEWDD
jgi:hypothetical protein